MRKYFEHLYLHHRQNPKLNDKRVNYSLICISVVYLEHLHLRVFNPVNFKNVREFLINKLCNTVFKFYVVYKFRKENRVFYSETVYFYT